METYYNGKYIPSFIRITGIVTTESTRQKQGGRKIHVNKTRIGKEIPVLQLSKKGAVISEFRSIIIAAQTLNICPQGISDCCNGKLKTSGGFCWKKKI